MDKVAIFAEALLKKNADERNRFLNESCGNDNDLRNELNALLAAHDDAGSFLQKTPDELAAGNPTAELSSDAWKAFLQPSPTANCLGTLDQYEVLELVGRGGMGVVLKARDTKLNRVIAIKMLAPEFAKDPVAVQRFLREAQAAAAVSHDHVVTIHAVQEELRPPIIAMEYVDGKSLQQKIDNEGALDVKSILRIGMQTASGLAAAHRQGLVHRDIKPANILLENGIERVKLTDFGLARAIDDIGITKTGTITGTPQYMSPEQAQGQPVDHRTDLFSLGCVLYAMCTGRAAFRADSAVAVMHCVVHQSPRRITELNEDVPAWLCDIVEKLLAKEPVERFESATELESLLRQHLAHLQRPKSVTQPAPIVKAAASLENANRINTSDTPTPYKPNLRGLTIVVLGYVGSMLVRQPDSGLLLHQAGIVTCVFVLAGSLCWLLHVRHLQAEKTSQLYAGYDRFVAVGMTSGFVIPIFSLGNLNSLLLSLLASLGIAEALHQTRRRSYARLGIAKADITTTPGTTIVDKFNTQKLNPIFVGIIMGFVVTAISVSNSPDRSDRLKFVQPINGRPQTDRIEEAPFLGSPSTSYSNIREPRDSAIDLAMCPDGQYHCVAFRGKVSPGLLRIHFPRNWTRSVAAIGVRAVAASSDSDYFAWVGEDGMPHLVKPSSARSVHPTDRFQIAKDGALTCVCFSQDGRQIFAGGDSQIHVWNRREGGPVQQSVSLDQSKPLTIAASQNGKSLAVGFEDGRLAIWEMQSLNDPPKILRSSSEDSVTTIDWSGDSSHLLLGTSAGTVTLMDLEGQSIQVTNNPEFSCRRVIFSPDNVWVISVANAEFVGHRIQAHVNPWLDPEFLPDDTRSKPFTDTSRWEAFINGMAIDSYGSKLVTCSSDGSYSTWEFTNQLSYSTPNSRAPLLVKTQSPKSRTTAGTFGPTSAPNPGTHRCDFQLASSGIKCGVDRFEKQAVVGLGENTFLLH